MKCINPKIVLVAMVCHLFCVSLNAQIYTQVTTSGDKGIRIVDPDGVRWWKLFDNPKTNVLLDQENPITNPSCPKDYIKLPLATLKQNAWLEYQDCADNPNKSSAQLRFYSDPNRVDKWVQMPPKAIPPPKKDVQYYWIIGGLLLLIAIVFLVRRRR